MSALMELTKARLTLLVVLTTVVGFHLGAPASVDLGLLTDVLAGTALLAAGAAVLNQVLEREFDARMRRTAERPIPSGRITPTSALLVGSALSLLGLVWLLFRVNPLTALLGVATWTSYVAVYTPLKRITVLNTVVGAVPGALPPLMGWSAATDSVSAPGWSLFGVLFFWQLPHFMAIAWLYREEYQRAGFRMLSGVDPDGIRTAASAVRNTLALLGVSLFPFVFGLVGHWYLVGAVVLGGAFLAFAIQFARTLSQTSARRLFFASIVYLPVLLGLLVLDKQTRRLTSQHPAYSTSGVSVPTENLMPSFSRSID
ncbi:MAG: protoheme IX farnesyltransferase [Verrucomicrobia bacterium]|nr:protoheme IX farnesyltransferase [Verrucomicrobiota bacterium]